MSRHDAVDDFSALASLCNGLDLGEFDNATHVSTPSQSESIISPSSFAGVEPAQHLGETCEASPPPKSAPSSSSEPSAKQPQRSKKPPRVSAELQNLAWIKRIKTPLKPWYDAAGPQKNPLRMVLPCVGAMPELVWIEAGVLGRQ